MDEEKYFAKDIPNRCCGFGISTDEVASCLNLSVELTLPVKIFKPALDNQIVQILLHDPRVLHLFFLESVY